MGVEDGRKTSGASAFGRRTDKRLVKQVRRNTCHNPIICVGY